MDTHRSWLGAAPSTMGVAGKTTCLAGATFVVLKALDVGVAAPAKDEKEKPASS